MKMLLRFVACAALYLSVVGIGYPLDLVGALFGAFLGLLVFGPWLVDAGRLLGLIETHRLVHDALGTLDKLLAIEDLSRARKLLQAYRDDVFTFGKGVKK